MSASERNWISMLGRGFLTISAAMFIVCALTTYSRVHMLHTWPVADGIIIEAHLTEEQGTNGGTLCGSQFKVRYTADQQVLETEHRSTSTSTDCGAWEREVAQMKGSNISMLYDPSNPSKAYPGGGRELSFFLGPIITGGLALAFVIAGTLILFFRNKLHPTETLGVGAN